MKKYLIKRGHAGLISVDTETNDLNVTSYLSTGIDWVYRVPEDGVVSIQDTDFKNKEVKKDDFIILFYNSAAPKHAAVVVTSKEWVENIEAKRKLDEAQECDICDCNCEKCCATESISLKN